MGGLVHSAINTAKAATNVVTDPLSKSSWMGLAKDATNVDPSGLVPSSVTPILQKAAPIALSFIPGAGPFLAAGYSAASSFGNNGNLGNAALQAGSTYAGGTGALGSVGAAALGYAAARANGASGNEALLSGALNAGNSYMHSGGFSDGGSGSSDVGSNGNGSILGTPASNMQGPTLSGAPLGAGTGILGAATRGFSGLSSALGIGGGGGASSFGGSGSGASGGSSFGNLGSLLAIGSGINTMNANNQAQKDLLNAQNNALAQLKPFQATGTAANARLSDLLGTSGNTTAAGYDTLGKPFAPSDLTQDPGYQFQLQQGNQALDRQQAAKGNYFSGGALKAAQSYGQGLADTTYNNAYQRYLAQQQQQYGMLAGQSSLGQNAATGAANINEGIGNTQAASTISSSNILNNTLSGLLSGSGAKRLVGYGTNGSPLYA